MPIDVRQEFKYGKVVWTNKNADDARRSQCLCTNGCRRFKNNLHWQEEQKKLLADQYSFIELIKEFAWRFLSLTDTQQEVHLHELNDDAPCPIAAANYVVCVSGDTANATTRCKWFVPDDTVTVYRKYRYSCDTNGPSTGLPGECGRYVKEFWSTDMDNARIAANFYKEDLDDRLLSPMDEILEEIPPEEIREG